MLKNSIIHVFPPLKEIMIELSQREKEAGVLPDPDIDTYMKVTFEFEFTGCYSNLILSCTDFFL